MRAVTLEDFSRGPWSVHSFSCGHWSYLTYPNRCAYCHFDRTGDWLAIVTSEEFWHRPAPLPSPHWWRARL